MPIHPSAIVDPAACPADVVTMDSTVKFEDLGTSEVEEYTITFPDRADIEPIWVADPNKTVDHNLGFCPVHWYRFMGSWAPTHEIDGEAIHATILDEIVALDFAVSQRHRAVLYNAYGPSHYTMVENTGLYWHLVDLIWIFLFPLLYLIH